MRLFQIAGFLTAVLLSSASIAQAHTIALGSTNAGGPGSVTLWMGTYDHGGPIAQGAITLIAGPSSVGVMQSFTSVVTTLPVGLIAGDNYFFADAQGSGQWGNLPANSYNQSINNVGLGPVVNWQGATFTGLTAGTYTYQLSGMTSQNWTNINNFQSNWQGTLVISGTSIGGTVPEPTSLALWGLGAAGMVLIHRRRVNQRK